MRSIERTLLAWVAGALSLGLVVVAIAGYALTLDEMNEVLDADLRNVTAAIAVHHTSASGTATAGPTHPATGDLPANDNVIVTTIWTRDGQRLYLSDPKVDLRFSEVPGLASQHIGETEWIVSTVVRGDRVVQAAQPKAWRMDLASESATQILPPMLVLVVVASGFLIFALRRGLRSLDTATRDVAARSERSLEPIEIDALPREILPLVNAVNGLMARLAGALSAQRQFLADAAHELRTPATALKLQLQLLERSPDEATRNDAMVALKAAVDRSQRLIEQLLQVARSGAEGEPMRSEPVDLSALAREVVGELSIKADHHGIDLGADTEALVMVNCDREQIRVLLNNLVENALRYTPAGGVVDVQVLMHNNQPTIRVVDNGPGIPEAERAWVFDRFRRGEQAVVAGLESGSGLGLAIVRAIANRHGAAVALHTAAGGRGLAVEVVFAPSPTAA